MRRQLMAAAVAAPDMSPEMLQGLVDVVGYDHLLGALRRLNETGQGIPSTALRTLSMLSLLSERGGSPSIAAPPLQAPGHTSVEGDPGQGRTREELQGLLDQLLGDEQASRYTSEEYEQTLREAEQRAQRLVRMRSGHRPLPMRSEEGEQHFLLVAAQLLALSPGEVEVAESVCRESQHSYVRFAEAAAPGPCAKAMRLAREARAATGVAGDGRWIWETPELLERLRQQLVEGKRTEAEASAELLVAIGEPTVPMLVDVLTTSVSLSVRRRALAALESLPRSPATALVPLLDPKEPWYVQRNAAYVLRRRRDPTGAEAAKAIWRHAEPRVRLEVLGYLLVIGDYERLRYLEEALADRYT
jgi:hypothetical protein